MCNIPESHCRISFCRTPINLGVFHLWLKCAFCFERNIQNNKILTFFKDAMLLINDQAPQPNAFQCSSLCAIENYFVLIVKIKVKQFRRSAFLHQMTSSQSVSLCMLV